jgi:Zn-dependent M28 family amino/carboxypeptidase
MASRMEAAGELDEIGAMILFDMIGDADLSFPKDDNGTAWLNELLWETAARLGYSRQFEPERIQFMEDDHLPFLERGVVAVDLIDYNYGPGNRYWHAPFDTMDKLAAGSFAAVGETVLTALPALAERLTSR